MILISILLVRSNPAPTHWQTTTAKCGTQHGTGEAFGLRLSFLALWFRYHPRPPICHSTAPGPSETAPGSPLPKTRKSADVRGLCLNNDWAFPVAQVRISP